MFALLVLTLLNAYLQLVPVVALLHGKAHYLEEKWCLTMNLHYQLNLHLCIMMSDGS
jgi:hypothetical protein